MSGEAGDERIDADDVEISAQRVYVNNNDAWTPQSVHDNVLWTKVGALAAVCSILLSVVGITVAIVAIVIATN